jgi:UDP-N-acetylglucosamine--N-acetylmuramyl-(pentapeptide) pyrophosphoryl-undecaprenol N-acetylglucosamine transferase
MGGSLGAKSINHAIAKNIKAFELNDLQLIWQTGKTTADQFIKVASGHLNIWAGAFINDIDKAYAAADIVISRSGAMAVTELCVTGKPTVFVPFPLAAEDHQTHNAMSLVNKQAALIVTDANASNDLVDTVIQLANNKLLQAQFTENAKALAITNADVIIANEILSLI